MDSKAPGANCSECPLQQKRYAPTQKPTGAKVAVVSRSPGSTDVLNRKPFSGESGKVLDYLLAKHNVQRKDVIVTNVVLCECEVPPKEAIAACRARLLSDIDSCDTVIAAGSEAVASLTKYRTIGPARGFVHYRDNSEGRKQRVVATNNPALVLRDNDVLPELLIDFKIALDPLPEPLFPKVEIIYDIREGRDYLRSQLASTHTYFSSDLEWHASRIECAGFATSPELAIVLSRECIEDKETQLLLSELYRSSDKRFIFHNGKSDTTVLRLNGIPGKVDEDTFALSRILDEEPGRHSLDYLLQTNFGWPNYEPESVKRFKKTGEFDADEEGNTDKAQRELYTYNGYDTAGTYQLFEVLSERVKAEGLWERPYRKHFIPAIEAFTQIEMRGFLFDPEEACNINERHVYPKLAELEDQLRQLSKHPLLNPKSSAQMASVYYNDFGLRHKLKDIGMKKFSNSGGKEVRDEIIAGRTTCKSGFTEILRAFAELHQIYSKIDKQRGTYLEGLTIRATEGTNRLHCHFNIGGTVTYRNTSKDPNFQNVTREGVHGIPGIRTIFLASEGNVILQADFSQAELRTCAVLSGELNLLSIYRDSTRSLHKERAAGFYGDDYTKEQYVKSKNINFGVTYGQSAFAFSQMYFMPEEEAQAYIDSWWREFPTLKMWTDNVWTDAKLAGNAQSPFGFKRRINVIPKDVKSLQRELVNFLPQNVAAWLTNCAIVDLVVDYSVPVISTVHDSIIIDVAESEAQETAILVKQVMEAQALKQLGWELPFSADIAIGDTWGSVKEIDLIAI